MLMRGKTIFQVLLKPLKNTTSSTSYPSFLGLKYNKYSFSTAAISTTFDDVSSSLGNGEVESVLFHYSRGDRFWSESRLEKALEEYHEVLKLVLQSKGLSFIDLNTVYRNMGHIYLNQKNFEESIKNYEKSLSISSKDFGATHFQTGYSYKLISLAYMQQANWEKAFENAQNALKIFSKTFEKEDPFLAECYYDFGLIYQSQGKLNFALKEYQKALKIYELEEESWNQVAELHNNIGHVHCQLKDFDNAKKSYENSLTISKKQYGQESIKVALNYNNIGGICYEKKDFEKAMSYYDKALEILKKNPKENGIYIAGIYFNKGNILMKEAKYNEATVEYLKALKTEKKAQCETHTNMVTIYKAIGQACFVVGSWKDALKFYKKALMLARKNANENDTLEIYSYIGKLYYEKGDEKKAETYSKKIAGSLEGSEDEFETGLYYGQRYFRLGRLGKTLDEKLQVLTIDGKERDSLSFLKDAHKRASNVQENQRKIAKIEEIEDDKGFFEDKLNCKKISLC